MGIKDLTDQELRAFIKDPKRFVQNEQQYLKLFDLTDRSFREKVEKIRDEMRKTDGVQLKE